MASAAGYRFLNRYVVLAALLIAGVGAFLFYPPPSGPFKNESAGLILIWSPHMPWSTDAVEIMERVAVRFGLPLLIYLDHDADENLAEHTVRRLGLPGYILKKIPPLEFDLIGSPAHTPAVYWFENGRPSGEPVLGLNSFEQYSDLIQARINGFKAKFPDTVVQPRKCSPDSTEIVSSAELSHYSLGFFHQLLDSKNLVFFALGNGSWSADLASGAVTAGPAVIDPFPTPDDALIVGLEGPERKLSFYLPSAWSDSKSKMLPLYADGDWGMVTYQSIGLLDERRYRIIARNEKGLFFRDYSFAQERISPLAPFSRLCGNLKVDSSALALPLLSKNGRRFSALDDRTGAHTIFTIDEKGNCAPEYLLPFRGIGKAAFSFSDTKIAFHGARDESGIQKSAFVYDWVSRDLWEIPPGTQNYTNLFPSFRKNGDVVLLSQPNIEDKESQLRPVLQVVRLKACH